MRIFNMPKKDKEDPEEFTFPEDDSPEEEEIVSGPDIIVVDGIFANGKTIIADPNAIPNLYEKSYFGSKTADNKLEIDTMETLMLLERKRIRVFNENQQEITFETVVSQASASDERFWTKYLIYRDLRQRGYIVRMGFGDGIDFRVFPRGAAHQEEIAKYFICILAEGDPVQLETLDRMTRQTITARKELLLAIIDRLGDPTYYKLEQFKLTPNDSVKGKWEK
jgi:tRNA-intron endonuclease